jgi:hypothetical protein
MLKILTSGAVAALVTLGAATLTPAGAAGAASATLLGEARSAAPADVVEVRDRDRGSRGRGLSRGERRYRGDGRYYHRSPQRWRRYDRRYRGPYYDPYYRDYYYDEWYGPACIVVGPLLVCP